MTSVCSFLVVMFRPVTIDTKHNALANFSLNQTEWKPQTYHIGYIISLRSWVAVVKRQVGPSTAFPTAVFALILRHESPRQSSIPLSCSPA